MPYLCQQNIRVMAEIIVILYFTRDENVRTVAYGKRHEKSSCTATQGNGLYLPPGEPVVFYNVINAPKENEGRWVHAEWASNVTSEKFKSTIDITSQPRDTLLADVTILLSNMHIPMHALVAKESKDHSVILIQVTVEVNGVDQLNYLLNSLRAIKGVEDVRRTIQ